ncbi:MAG: Kelch repeat-containing protein [Sphingomicrobium sp.]
MSTPRASHAAIALPNGDVLFIGGCVEGSCEVGPASRTIDRYDSRTETIARAGVIHVPRSTMSAALLPDGRVLIAGGWSGPTVTDAIELYDPRAGRSRAAGALAVARADIAQAVLPDGRVVLAGGINGRRMQSVIEVFDPATNRVTVKGQLSVPRSGAATTVLGDGRVLIAGGYANGPQRQVPSAAAELFDPRDGSVKPAGAPILARYKHAAVTLRDGRVLVIGGSDARDRGGKIRTLEIYDPKTNRFTKAGETIDARYKIPDAAVLLPDGRVLIAGGAAQAEIYDPATGRSVHAGPMLGEALNFASATLLADGSVLVVGGYSEDGLQVRDRVWRFTPPPSPIGTRAR